jgi:hypothetical protein
MKMTRMMSGTQMADSRGRLVDNDDYNDYRRVFDDYGPVMTIDDLSDDDPGGIDDDAVRVQLMIETIVTIEPGRKRHILRHRSPSIISVLGTLRLPVFARTETNCAQSFEWTKFCHPQSVIYFSDIWDTPHDVHMGKFQYYIPSDVSFSLYCPGGFTTTGRSGNCSTSEFVYLHRFSGNPIHSAHQ